VKAICIREGQATNGIYYREDLNTIIDVPDDSRRDLFQPAEYDETGGIRPLDEKECLQMMGMQVEAVVEERFDTEQEDDLENMTKQDLAVLAIGYNIEGAEKMTKAKLVEAIIAAKEAIPVDEP
jgi:hypothetical protein